jgi:hypothetical protein
VFPALFEPPALPQPQAAQTHILRAQTNPSMVDQSMCGAC